MFFKKRFRESKSEKAVEVKGWQGLRMEGLKDGRDWGGGVKGWQGLRMEGLKDGRDWGGGVKGWQGLRMEGLKDGRD